MSTGVDWFSEHADTWMNVLKGKLISGGKKIDRLAMKKPKLLFVGPYDGKVVEWTLGNLVSKDANAKTVVLFDEKQYDTCVYYKGKPTRTPPPLKTLNDRFPNMMKVKDITAAKDGKVSLVSGAPMEKLVLQTAYLSKETFNLIYIDAMTSESIMHNLVLLFPLLCAGKNGTLIITNNTHNAMHTPGCPRRGIDGFIDANLSKLHVIRNGFHTFVEKRLKPIKLPPCRSEYWENQNPKDPKC